MKVFLLLLFIYINLLSNSNSLEINISSIIKNFKSQLINEEILLEYALQANDETINAFDLYYKDIHKIELTNNKIKKNSFFLKEFQKFQELANKNDNDAQYILYYMYKNGYGIELNLEKSMYWLDIAYKNKNDYASFEIAKQNMKNNFKFAINLMNKLVEKNFLKACQELGDIYRLGRSVNIDYNKAIFYYKKASKLNDGYAQFRLSEFYIKGIGIEKDVDKGIQYLKSSINNGSSLAFDVLSDYYFEGKYVKKDYEKAFYLYCQSIPFLDPKALYKIGLMYEKGLFVEKNEEISLFFYKLASNFNYAKAQYKLAIKNYLKLDILKMFDLLKYSSNYNGYSKSSYILGVIYANGIHTKQNYFLAFQYFQEASTHNHPESLFYLGELYEYGLGVIQNGVQAKKFYKDAINIALKEKNCALLNLAISNQNILEFKNDINNAKVFKECSASDVSIVLSSINKSIESRFYWESVFKYYEE
jgi:TPR repeat protein